MGYEVQCGTRKEMTQEPYQRAVVQVTLAEEAEKVGKLVPGARDSAEGPPLRMVLS